MIRPHRWRRWGLALLVVAACAPPAQAQLFVAERPHPDFQVGPLFVGAIVTPRLGHAVIDVHFSLTFPPDKTIAGMEQDLYLLWPGPVTPDRTAGPPDRALARYVEARGFTVIEEGRTSLHALELYTMGTGTPPRRLPDGAPFVTFVRTGGALGLTSPATWIRIPWNYRMANRVWLMDLRFTDPSFVHPKASNWLERTLWGPRHRVSLSFNDVRARAMFPMYFEHRDRIVRLAEDPSQLLISFRESDHLKIDSMSPPAANRRLSETEEQTEVVSLYLDRSEGITPQTLSVQFGYFSGWQAWAPILIPALFFLAGNIAGPLLSPVVRQLGRKVSARVHLGREGPPREQGTVIPRETLARIVPGQTTHEQVLQLCGPDPEEHEQLTAPDQRVLIYRGRVLVPRRRRVVGWLATVSGWDVEHHEAEITLERNVVRDVQARVRRSRLSEPG